MTENLPQKTEEVPQSNEVVKMSKKRKAWPIIGIIVLVLAVLGGVGGGYMIHLSNTSPEFCQICHIMEPNVSSYLTSNDLDNFHNQAGVECKECHDYPLDAEISSGFKFLVGDFDVDSEGKLLPVTYGNDMCFKCHISYDQVAQSTDFLTRNPHKSHNGELPCKTCHVSHGDQIDYCGQCHDNGDQRMVGGEIEFRGTIP